MKPSTVGAYSASDHGRHDGGDRRSIAQWYCLLGGLALLLAGVFGFLADASFDTASTPDTDPGGNADGMLQGDSFLGFEVNGWHNVVHIASGLLLLIASRRVRPARAVAIGFGVVYGIVAIIGLIDGNDVLGFIPINGADNILHVGLALLGIVAGLASRPAPDDRATPDRAARRTNRFARPTGERQGVTSRENV